MINTSLMDNHQLEVAEALQGANHLKYCDISTLAAAFEDFDPTAMEPLPPSDTSIVVAACREEAGLVPTDLVDDVKAELEARRAGKRRRSERKGKGKAHVGGASGSSSEAALIVGAAAGLSGVTESASGGGGEIRGAARQRRNISGRRGKAKAGGRPGGKPAVGGSTGKAGSR